MCAVDTFLRMSLNRKKLLEIKERFERAIGPIAAGVILDLVDLAMWGTVGLIFGLVIGAAVGWYLSGVLNIPKKWRPTLATLAGIYCMMPQFRLIPVATIVGACARFFEPPVKKAQGDQ